MFMASIVINLSGPVAVAAVLITLALAVVWVAALVSVLTRADAYASGSQLLWTLVVLLAGPVGAVLYFVLAREVRVTEIEPIPDRRSRARAIADPWSDRTGDP